MDLKTERGIADARHAIWKSDTIQMHGEYMRQHYQEIKKEQWIVYEFYRAWLAELDRTPLQLESKGGLTDRDTLPTSIRTVRGSSVSTPSKEESREEKFRTAREEAAKRRAARSNQR